MTPSRARLAETAAAAAAAGLLSAALLAGLSAFPAITLDEAWIGLFARRLEERGLCTPHQMNDYTGPLYAWGLSRVFAWLGPSVESLRLPGALANLIAVALAAGHLRRRAGAAAAGWFLLLCSGSAYLLVKSRLAWEVYALQPLLIAGLAALLAPVEEEDACGFLRAAAFCALAVLGAQNHFIFISVPLALAAQHAARAAWRREAGLSAALRLSLAALLACAAVYLIKPRLSEAAWQRQSLWAGPVFLLLPFLGAAAAGRRGWERPLVEFLARPAAERLLPRLAGLSIVAFFVWHGGALAQVLSGGLVWKRAVSWAPPWWLSLPSQAWALALLAFAAWRAARAWHEGERLTAHERTLALWPAAYAAVFIAFRHTSSLRYYSPVQFLLLLAMGAGLARLPRPDRKLFIVPAALLAAATLLILGREIRSPADRRPLSFRLGWRSENSWDFARKEALFSAFDASGACGLVQLHSFTDLPLLFHALSRPAPAKPCDPTLSFLSDYRKDGAGPPWHSWGVVRR